MVSPQVMEALVEVISGGSGMGAAKPPIGIYRTANRITGFMRACGAPMEDGPMSRMPALRAALDRVVANEDRATLTRIIEAAASPADLPDAATHARVVEYLNLRLAGDGLALTEMGGRMVCRPTHQVATVAGQLSAQAAAFDFDTVRQDLDRALANAQADPEDAITAACSILESMCRSILVELGLPLPEKRDLTSLYKAVREPLRLSADRNDFPAEVSNDVRGILGGLANVVQNVGALRTHAGDAHGRERGYPRADARIARLAVHAASAAAIFLLETWERERRRALPMR